MNFIVQQINVATGDFEMDSHLYTSQLPFHVHREEVEIEFKAYPQSSVLFGQKDEDYIAWRGDDGSWISPDRRRTRQSRIRRNSKNNPTRSSGKRTRTFHTLQNSFTPPTPENLQMEDGTGYTYEDGGYVWQEGDYDPHNPWGFGQNPWRVITEEGTPGRNTLTLQSCPMTPVIIPDEHSIEVWIGESFDAIPMGDIIVYNHNRDREDYIDYRIADLIMENGQVTSLVKTELDLLS